jgi:hypothetical protein
MSRPCYHRRRWLVGMLVAGLVQRLQPWIHADDIAWFRLNGMPEPSVGLEVDGSQETTTIGGIKSIYDTLFITPTVGLRGSGSIYHPNLLAFDFNGDLGWGWNNMTTTSPGYRQTIDESDQLHRYFVEADLLQEKPYHLNLYASEDHTYRDYGSFDTYTVDLTRYGGHFGWETGPWSVTSDFGYQDESDTGLLDSSETKETFVNLLAINKRQFGQTTLTAQWDMFDNILNFGNSVTSVNESVGLADSETFGSHKQITASTSASFSHAENAGQATDIFNATENINVHHTRDLNSFLIFNFEHNELQPASENYAQGTAGVRHQLYESLTSTLDVHGSYEDNSDPSGSSSTDLYGVTLAENYLKRLQSWGRLTIGASITADHQDQTTSGGALTVIAESHQLYLPTSAQYRPVYLNQPEVIAASIQVTANGQPLVQGSDYEVVPSGQLTEIRLISPPSSHLQSLLGAADNLSVSVNYQSESAFNASYESLDSNIQIRLDLFGRFGIYGRMNWMDNNAPPAILTETLTDLIGGVDYNWRWLRAGAEYEDYDSNFTQYNSFRFFQNLNFTLDHRSSLSLNCDETFYHYPASGDQTLYQFTTRYNLQIWSSFSCYLQGGFSWQDVLGSHEIDGSAQAGFSWTRGKLSVRSGYEYTSQNTTSGPFTENMAKNRIFAYLKRTF